MKKYFVFSDVHSNYDALKKALDDAGFDINNPEHCIISCGDLMDRHNQPIECLKFVNSIPDDRKILIEGNHEDLLKSLIRRKMAAWFDAHNGTDETLELIAENTKCYHDDIFKDDYFLDAENNPELKKYFESLVFYHETPNHIFVHGWIPVEISKMYGKKDWRDVADHRNAWFGTENGAAWVNGMREWSKGNKDSQNKTIVCGHWDSNWGHISLHNEYDKVKDLNALYDLKKTMDQDEWNKLVEVSTRTFEDDDIVALDACTAFSNRVNVYVINEDDL